MNNTSILGIKSGTVLYCREKKLTAVLQYQFLIGNFVWLHHLTILATSYVGI